MAVIGGGNSGVEAAIDLAGIVGHVTLIEFDDRLRADEVLQRKLRSLPNVDVIVSAADHRGARRRRRGHRPASTRTAPPARPTTSTSRACSCRSACCPNTEWLEGAVELSPRGEIVIDDRGQTSLPGVFAAGDCTTVPYKQIVIAMGAGSTAALSAPSTT